MIIALWRSQWIKSNRLSSLLLFLLMIDTWLFSLRVISSPIRGQQSLHRDKQRTNWLSLNQSISGTRFSPSFLFAKAKSHSHYAGSDKPNEIVSVAILTCLVTWLETKVNDNNNSGAKRVSHTRRTTFGVVITFLLLWLGLLQFSVVAAYHESTNQRHTYI